MRRRKLAMIGIDAGDRLFIETHASALPHLTRVFREGAVTDLVTSSELLTGSVWPTFYTGRSPGEHGLYHHLQWDPAQMRIRRVAADWLYSEPFWYELAREGLSVAVLDVPMTFPSRLDRGIEVINWGSHDQLGVFHSNRPDLARAIRARFGRHPMGPEIPVHKTYWQLQHIRDNLVRGAARKGALIRWLLESQEWDFFLAAFGECHRGGHILWPEDRPGSVVPEHALVDVYRAVDEALGNVLPLLERTAVTLVLFALHGMESNRSQEHFVPRVMDRVNGDFRGDDGTVAAPPGQRSLMRYLRGALPARLQHAVARAVPVAIRDWVVGRATASGHHWRRTPGFALLADHNGYLRLNLAGREREGCLPATGATHERYQRWLREQFLGLRILATGEPLVREVVAASAVFPGPRSAYLPDLIVTWSGAAPATAVTSEALGTIEAALDTGRSGNHRHQGFAAILGDGRDGEAWRPRHIQDLAALAHALLEAA